MTIVEQLDAELRAAMHARDHHTINTIRMLKSRIGKLTSDDDVRAVIRTYRNQMHDALGVYATSGDRGVEHADQLVLEIAFCERYVAPLLDEGAVRALVREAITTVGTDRGKVIGHVIRAHKDEVLGAQVARLVDVELLK
jgi:uncharacterized protein YqeY